MLAYIPPKPNATYQDAVDARALMHTLAGVEAKIDRMVHAEGTISELHGLTRARARGTRKLQLQLLAAATAINLKRLLAHGDAHGAADAPGDHPAAQPLIRASTPGQRHTIANALLTQLTATLNEIDRLTATDTSTGS